MDCARAVQDVAWRVALASTGGALAAGLLGLLVSRGSSLLMEGIETSKQYGPLESAIPAWCPASCGMLSVTTAFMWSQSVIVEVYSFSVAIV